MNYYKTALLLAGITLYTASCKKEKDFDPNAPDVLVTNRDTLVDPSDDFFAYANGGWFKKNPIPSTERSNGIFRTIGDTINSQIRQICEKSAADSAEKGSNKQKIGDFYASGMDTITIDKLGISPLKNELAKIDKIKDIDGLLQTMAYMHTIGASPAFGFYVGQDDKNSTQYALFLSQGGLGMGNRDYYVNSDKETVTIRNEYVKHLEAMSKLMGNDASTSKKNATIIMKLETELALNSRKLEDLRDPNKNYNKMSLEEFKAFTPSMPWDSMLAAMHIKNAKQVIVGQPEFYKALDQTLRTYSLSDWKTYLKWDLINTYASYLGKDFEKQNFYFYSTVMGGVKEQKPRWKRVVEQTDNSLGELIGQVYVEEYLPEGTKEKLLEIGNNIRDVYAERIQKLDWMSPETKKKALHKLSKIVMKVGYPDKWKDMSSVNIDRKTYCANVMSVNKWAFNDMVAKYGKPVDRTEWGMYPQTYNAYYNPSNNEICVPACNIIVPGFEGRFTG